MPGVVVGAGLTVTAVVPVAIQPEPGVVTVTVYIVASISEALLIDGVATDVELKSGPLHEYERVPEVDVAFALKLIVPPTQAGLLLPGAVVGAGLTVTVVVPIAIQPEPVVVTVTVYIVASPSEALPIDGVAKDVELKSGPLHV